jgi:hypothetical protein
VDGGRVFGFDDFDLDLDFDPGLDEEDVGVLLSMFVGRAV